MPIICDSPRDRLLALHEKLIRKGLVQNTPLTMPPSPIAKRDHKVKPQQTKPYDLKPKF